MTVIFTVNIRRSVAYIVNNGYHMLRDSASLVLTATGFVIGKWQFSTPTESTPLNRSPTKFVTGDYIGDPYGCAKLGAYPSTGGYWHKGEI